MFTKLLLVSNGSTVITDKYCRLLIFPDESDNVSDEDSANEEHGFRNLQNMGKITNCLTEGQISSSLQSK